MNLLDDSPNPFLQSPTPTAVAPPPTAPAASSDASAAEIEQLKAQLAASQLQAQQLQSQLDERSPQYQDRMARARSSRASAAGAAAAPPPTSAAPPGPLHVPDGSVSVRDLPRFVMRPGPKDAMVRCVLRRQQTSSGGAGGKLVRSLSFGRARGGGAQQYELYLEEGDVFLLAAKKMANLDYRIAVSPEDITKESPAYVGKLRVSLGGSEFSLYDRGDANPDVAAYDGGADGARTELACMMYQQPDDKKLPIEMVALVPPLGRDGKLSRALPPRVDGVAIEDRVAAAQATPDGAWTLRSKRPTPTPSGALALDFGGRATAASVKNMMLYNATTANPDRVCFLLGKTGPDEFACDYAYPLTALQAMGLALTAFHDMSRRLNLGLKGGKLGYKSGQGD